MARCLTNHHSLTAGWLMYSNDNDGFLMSNGDCYDNATDKSPWVHRPKDITGNSLTSPHPRPLLTRIDIEAYSLGRCGRTLKMWIVRHFVSVKRVE
ncbi:MAG: hypothetical protein GY845_33210 [Planctomycetes bacterium]|nr:hypothetical protein [Planctomycetota bacterium]